MNSILWGCIADDFTGASDAASFFKKGGLKTVLYNGIPEEGEMCIRDRYRTVFRNIYYRYKKYFCRNNVLTFGHGGKKM